MRRNSKRLVALGMGAALALSTMAVTALPTAGSAAATDDDTSAPGAFSVAGFADPSIEYRPGVRWWWPGGAVETEVLGEQLDYLAEHGFGTVEINPFGVEALPGDEEKVRDVYTDTFYDKLEYAVAKAEDLGITVDLNMGTGWNANSADVTLEDAEGNLALGRTVLSGAEVKAGGIAVPAPAKSMHYSNGSTWAPEEAKLQGVLLARRTGVVGSVTGDAALFDDGATVWDERISLDDTDRYMIDVPRGASSFDVPTEVADQLGDDADYEVVALYSLPAGAKPVDAARPDWYVVDHMDARETYDYVTEWVGEERLNSIVNEHDNVRALFNDSLELGPDLYYTDALFDLAADAENNGLGYDFSPYLATVYRQNLDMPAYRGNQLSGSTEPYLTFSADTEVSARILNDFRRLLGTLFAKGLQGFQRATNSYGLEFRQQAYNPPMDQIGAAKYVDIPEQEQADEYNLRTAASGGHLYGRNLVTAEQYTLGLTPMLNTLDTLRNGFEIMATSGVNNFFYHGLNYPYGVDSDEYGENGWAAFPTIGVNMSEKNTLSPYFGELNDYAARLNYVGQQGDPSVDVAVYAPFDTTATADGATPVLHRNGYTWDVINDASLTAGSTEYVDGELRVNGDTIAYDALVVQSNTVPVATMQALQRLADQGAPIVFYGALPDAQDGYAGGDYAARDAKVADLAEQVLLTGSSAYHRTTEVALTNMLRRVVDPELSHAANDDLRTVRRTLSDGSELMFVRNLSPETTTVALQGGEDYEHLYWLDQNDGSVHEAESDGGDLSFTLAAGQDGVGTFGGPTPPSNGIALLATDSPIATDDLTEGTPTGVDVAAPDASTPVEPTSLTVTSDSLDGVRGGAVTTETFTGSVLGNWKNADVADGRLRSVAEDGTYTAEVTVEKRAGERYVLDLGTVHSAARVTVNGQDAGAALWAPYEVDVTDLVVDGSNTVEITVTPRKKNRYFPADVNSDGAYAMDTPQDAGLIGPVMLETTAGAPVAKVRSEASLRLRPGKVRAGHRAQATIRVTAAGGVVPTGKTRLLSKGKLLRVATLNKRGAATVTLPRLPRGKHRIKVVYAGDAQVRRDVAFAVLRVVKGRR
ncbi:glycosyl hydrolase [Nocardioides sambongensis]|uniref:glycosyl hydrolase n=1 Tax=Nocardioides sambongensis TaxID=2589074 RepID=UPI00112DF281|nr:glycosyl hydrolase [Nocardioides sambongensis]